MFDKERLFEYRRVSKVNIYSMNEFEDYYYGYMVPDAGYLKYYALYLYDEGFIIQMPTLESPETVEPFSPRPKLFQVLKRSVLWGDMQGIDTVGALNDMVTQHDMSEVVLVQEAYQERQIGEIAKQIADRPEAQVCPDSRAFLLRKDNILTPAFHPAPRQWAAAAPNCR